MKETRQELEASDPLSRCVSELVMGDGIGLFKQLKHGNAVSETFAQGQTPRAKVPMRERAELNQWMRLCVDQEK